MSETESSTLRSSIERVSRNTTLDSKEVSERIARCMTFGLTLNEAEKHIERTFPRPRITRLSGLKSEQNGLEVTTTIISLSKLENRSSGSCTDGETEMPIVVWGARAIDLNTTIRIVGAKTKLWGGALQLQIPEYATVMVLPTLPPEIGPVKTEVETVLFACLGNTCRSPMAEILLNEFGEGRYLSYSERARGGKGGGVAQGTKAILTRVGIPTERIQTAALPTKSSFSKIIVIDDVGASDNLEAAKERRQGNILHWQVDDPIHGDYEACYDVLREKFKVEFELELPKLP